MTPTKAEIRDANLICAAYFDIFQHNKLNLSWKPNMMRIMMWIRKYHLRERKIENGKKTS